MVITHQMQPTLMTCAQTCIAMLLGIPVEEVMLSLPDKKSGTQHKAMIAYLHARGVSCASRLTSLYGKELPSLAFARIRLPDKQGGHLVLRAGDTWHDPALPTPFRGKLPADRHWGRGRYVTSFLDLSSFSTD